MECSAIGAQEGETCGGSWANAIYALDPNYKHPDYEAEQLKIRKAR
jgi:hypothetical protein